jgi:hypothetical protein
MSSPSQILSPVQARILAVLIEKERTVPDSYPLSLNGLQTGCNQKTAREPVMELSESEILAALDELKSAGWITDHLAGRVARYSHRFGSQLGVPSQSVAVLATLMLRGPQTAAELRSHCERLHRFADISALEGFLAELAERSAGALVQLLPRQPGARESRWAHLLCGEPILAEAVVASSPQASGELLARIAALEEEIVTLKNEFSAFKRQFEA